MKTITALVVASGIAALLCLGCSKKESATGTSGSEDVVVDQVTVEETVTEAADTAKKVISDANAQAQELLTQAQKLVGEKKYEEALNVVQKLADFKLTPEQQKLYDNLKATIQKAMESGAVQEGTKAIGNMLGGEKQ